MVLKPEADKLDIHKLIKVPTNLNNLKTKVDDIDTGKLKKKTVYKKLNTKKMI